MIVIIFLTVFLTGANAQINIWEETSCHKQVELYPYLSISPKESSNLAIIICPGGSYFWHDIHTEGHEVGKWLQNNGISAFVLRYRTAYVPAYITHSRLITRGTRYPDPQKDLRQAIRYVKQHAEEFKVDTTKIGVMGFSAGGHLALSAAEFFDKEDLPAFVAAIYPVVTMSEPYVHKRSRRGLFGDSRTNNADLQKQLSLELHVPTYCPPIFLTNCVDDPIVDYHNSELLDSALTSNHVEHRYIQFKTGGHGFGVSEEKGTPECRQWKTMFLNWIKEIIKK